MSVLIDGVPMPKDCRDCCFKYESDASDRLAYCYISGCWIIPKDSERAEVCLLKETQPERLSDDDFETIRIHLSAFKERLCNQHRWEEAQDYQRLIDRFMSFAEQPEPYRKEGE